MKIKGELKNRIKKAVLKALHDRDSRDVVVRSAHKLTQAELDQVKKIVPQTKSITISNEVDAHLLGGIVIVDGSTVIDLSVRGKINELVAHLLAH